MVGSERGGPIERGARPKYQFVGGLESLVLGLVVSAMQRSGLREARQN